MSADIVNNQGGLDHSQADQREKCPHPPAALRGKGALTHFPITVFGHIYLQAL